MTKTNDSVAEIIKTARQDGQYSLDAIAKETCVSLAYLKAIEGGKYDALPAEPFAAGFVKTYAQAVGLNPQSIVALYKAETGQQADEAKQDAMKAASDGGAAPALSHLPAATPHHRLGWFVPSLAACLIATAWAMFGSGTTGTDIAGAGSAFSAPSDLVKLEAISATINPIRNTTDEQEGGVNLPKADYAMVPSTTSVHDAVLILDPSPAVSKDAATPSQPALSTAVAEQPEAARRLFDTAFDTAAYAEPVASDSVPHKVRVDAVEETWVRFANADGSEVWAGVLPAGDSFLPQVGKATRFSASNAGGVKIYVDDHEVPKLGARGQLIRSVALGSLIEGTHSPE